MGPRAGIIVTGTEILTGRVSDRNGPWLADQLMLSGVDVAQIIVVGDRGADLEWALRTLAQSGVDLVITTGGLGPTADDLTAGIVADVQGRPTQLDEQLRVRIDAIITRLTAARGWQVDAEASAHGVRKQAMVPVGARALPPIGTAPGLVVPVADGRTGPPVLVLPGPPPELQGMWPSALADDIVQAALSGRTELRQRTLRLWGTVESDLAATLRKIEPALDGLEITTCLSNGELEIVTRYRPAAQDAYDGLVLAVRGAFPDTLFSEDGRSIDQIVADALLERQLTIATAESCTAGMLAARLTDLAGSSRYVLGGLVVYSNAAKHALAGVDEALIASVGAVSAEVARELAVGARQRLGADLGVGITGIAGPGGATPGKPVGLVHLCVASADAVRSERIVVNGSRALVRSRTTVVALHMLRQLLVSEEAQRA
ncbi:competence/damage-inducible protein A [soil metagenome]